LILNILRTETTTGYWKNQITAQHCYIPV
jgi:hypothetical protein